MRNIKGYTKKKYGYQVQMTQFSETIYIGHYPTPEKAREEYFRAKAEYEAKKLEMRQSGRKY